MFTITRLKLTQFKWTIIFCLLMLLIPIIKSHAFQVDSVKFKQNLELFHQHKFANVDSAGYYLKKMDDISSKDENSTFRYRYYVTSGGWNRIKRDISESVASYKKALQLAVKLKNEEFVVKSKFNLASGYSEIGDYKRAIELYKEVEMSIDKVKTDGDLFSQQFWANQVGFYLMTNDHPTAFKYSDKMKANLKTSQDSIIYYSTRLHLLNNAKRYQENIQLGEEALRKSNKNDLNFRYDVYGILGSAYTEVSDYRAAFKNLSEARDLSLKLGIESGQVERLLGLLYFKTRDYDKAIVQFNRFMELSDKQGILSSERLAASDLADVYSAMNRPSEALKYTQMYLVLNDSILGIEKVKAIKDAEARYELSDKEKTIEQQREVNALQEDLLREGNQRRIILVGFLTCAVLLAGALWFFYRKTTRINKQLVIQRNQIEEYATELKSANLMRDKLFAIISHDLRSPVSSLVHSLEQYESAKPLNNLLFALNNVQLILNNLLKWAQIQLSEKPLRPKSIHLDWLLKSIIKQFSPVINEKQIQVVIDFKHSGTVLADEEGLSIILRNIISNAVKFTGDEGFIRLTTKEEGGFILVTIRDSGIGMSDEQLKALYVYPESQSGTMGEKGTGLGMTLTKELLEKMNGHVKVKSKQSVGTSIELMLPVYNLVESV